MSRIGNTPVVIPAQVKVSSQGKTVTVEGPKGKLDLTFTGSIDFSFDPAAKVAKFTARDGERETKRLHGLYRSLLNNMVKGVSQGYRKVLTIEGVGYRAVVKGKTLELALGYADPKVVAIPDGITVTVPQISRIEITGINKETIGQFTALVRKQRPPDAYKGKGILFEGEVVRKKPGKSFVGEEG